MVPSTPKARNWPSRLLRSHWLRPLNDVNAWNRVLQRLHPMASLDSVRARVIARVVEGEDTISLWLRPNRHWRGHVAGQHVLLGVEIDGVLRQRAFSLSNAAGRRQPIRITLRRQPGQGTTDWLFRNADVGLLVSLSQASGGFVLPSPAPPMLLMVAAGSGITPLLAMLQELASTQYRGDVQLLQLSRSVADRLFAEELEGLRQQLPGLRIHEHFSLTQGRFDVADLAALMPDVHERHTLVCGPPALTQAIDVEFSGLGLSPPQQERFGAPLRQSTPGEARSIHAADSEQVFTQSDEPNLLLAAEAAGLQPRYGCRAGLCRTCLCKKQRGSVRNLLTGQVSAQPDEWIQLCISVAESDLELAL